MPQSAAIAISNAVEEQSASERAGAADFEAMYERFGREISTYALRAVGDRHAAEDVASETFAIALRTFGRFRDRGDGGRAWLYRIATNELRRHARRCRRDRAALRTTIAYSNASDGELRERARLAMGALSWRHRSALLLHHVQGLSVEQTARVLGCRPGTIKSRLARARAQMLAELERQEIAS